MTIDANSTAPVGPGWLSRFGMVDEGDVAPAQRRIPLWDRPHLQTDFSLLGHKWDQALIGFCLDRSQSVHQVRPHPNPIVALFQPIRSTRIGKDVVGGMPFRLS